MKWLWQLGKGPISALTAFSAAAGYVLQQGGVGLSLGSLIPGVFLLAWGASAVNQIQERESDARMARTRNRPLPAGRLPVGAAWALGGAALLAGASILALGCGWTPLALGVLTVLWYNALYTPFKRRSPLASLVGGAIGALPPAIGWSAAAGSLLAPGLWVVMGFMYLWQVPHFWIISLRFDEEYRLAGVPLMTAWFSREQLGRMTSVWMLAVGLSVLSFPLFGLVRLRWVWFALALLSGWIGLESVRLAVSPGLRDATLARLGRVVNLFAALTLLLLFVDHGLFGER